MAYRTKQQQAVLQCFASDEEASLTALDVVRALQNRGERVGLATVYRQLDKLEREGAIHKVATDAGSLYQYCPHPHGAACLLVRCEACGRLEHVDCAELAAFARHMAAHHAFRLDLHKTVLTGVCARCAEEGSR